MNDRNVSRDDWDRRAREDARGFTASHDHGTEEQFAESGRRDARLIFEFSGLPADRRQGRALEIGCGIGRLLPYMVERFESVTGVDVSPVMIARAQERLGGRARFATVEGDGRIPLDGTFDLVYSYTVFQHIPRKFTVAYIGEAARLLKPGGAAVLHFAEPRGLRRRLQALLHLDPPDSDTFHFRYFRRSEVERRAGEAGLKVAGYRGLDGYGLYRLVKGHGPMA